MSDSRVRINPDSQTTDGKQIDTEQVTVASEVVHRQRVQITGVAAAEKMGVANAHPADGDYGAVVRPIPRSSTAGTPSGVTVSTSAVSIKSSNTARRAIVITNNGVGNLYLGHTSGVTSSGSNMGLLIPPGGAYTDSGDGIYTGDIYGIYSQTSSSQNVSVSERT